MRLLWAYEHDFAAISPFLSERIGTLCRHPSRVSLARAESLWLEPASTLGDLRVTVRASPLGTSPRTSYSSRSERPSRFPGDFAGSSDGAASISFGALTEDRMSIAASGDGLTSSEDEGSAGLAPSGVVATATPDPELTAMLARSAVSILFLFRCWPKGQWNPLSQRKSNFLFLWVFRSAGRQCATCCLLTLAHDPSCQRPRERGSGTQ